MGPRLQLAVFPSLHGEASDPPLPAVDPTWLAPFLAHLVYTDVQNESFKKEKAHPHVEKGHHFIKY